MNKDFILKKRKDFVRVAQGIHMVTSTVILQAAQSLCEETVNYKLGFTTTKKLGKAHIRNRIRRRMRAVARDVFPKYGHDNTEYVLIGRYSTASCPYKTLKSDLKWAIKKIHKIMNGEEEASPALSSTEKENIKKSEFKNEKFSDNSD